MWVKVEEALPIVKKDWLVAGTQGLQVAFYANKFQVEMELGEYSEGNEAYYLPRGWYGYDEQRDMFFLIEGVTHWMPLPEAPEAANG